MDLVTQILKNPLAVQTAIIGGTGLVCAVILAVAARFLAVHEDPRIEAVTALLPGINCGGCGYAGCSEYAKAVVAHGAPVNLCKPGGKETLHKLSAYMGIEAAAGEREVALVLCQGSHAVARRKALYNGVSDCTAAQQIGGNGKACRYGCLGLGSCARICPVEAIEIKDGLAIVHPDLCIGCTQCVATCPRRMIKMVPESRFIHVLCLSKDRGPEVKKVCDVGCIACTLCVKACGGKGIAMDGALAIVDYSVPLDNEETIAKCPMHTLVKRLATREAKA